MGWVTGWMNGPPHRLEERWPFCENGDPLRAWAVIQSLKDQGATSFLWCEGLEVLYTSGQEAEDKAQMMFVGGYVDSRHR